MLKEDALRILNPQVALSSSISVSGGWVKTVNYGRSTAGATKARPLQDKKSGKSAYDDMSEKKKKSDSDPWVIQACRRVDSWYSTRRLLIFVGQDSRTVYGYCTWYLTR